MLLPLLAHARPVARAPPVLMLRNIDSCEALIFSRDAALDASSGELRSAVPRLVAEARDQGALLAVLEPSDRPIDAASPVREQRVGCWPLASPEPQVSEISELRRALLVDSPEGFGGTDGFNQAPGLAFGREPLPERCVVLVTEMQEVIAALGAGMRAVAVPRTDEDYVDSALDGIADVCLDELEEVRVEDLSTPGAYWLNPALPRDVSGNMVDPDTGVPLIETAQQAAAGEEAATNGSQQSSSSSSPPPPAARGALEITPAEAAALDPSWLLDVRQPGEYRLDGHVDGSVNIAAYTWEHGFYLPAAGFAAAVFEAGFDRDEPVVLLCADGKLARGAAAALVADAFTNVCLVEGGLEAWEAEAEDEEAGLPKLVVDDDGEGALTGSWV